MNSGLVLPGELVPESEEDDCPNREYQTACNGSPGGVFGVVIPVSIGTSKDGELNPDGEGNSGLCKNKIQIYISAQFNIDIMVNIRIYMILDRSPPINLFLLRFLHTQNTTLSFHTFFRKIL